MLRGHFDNAKVSRSVVTFRFNNRPFPFAGKGAEREGQRSGNRGRRERGQITPPLIPSELEHGSAFLPVQPAALNMSPPCRTNRQRRILRACLG